MATVTIEICTEWFKDDPDFTSCDNCGEIMVSHTNGLYLFSNFNLFDEEPEIKVCDSCCSCLNNSDGN